LDLQGKTALVTGSALRIGRAIALALAEKGCNLILHYKTSEKAAEDVQSAAINFGVKALCIQGDFSRREQVETLIPTALESIDHIDILINNAGIYISGSGLETNAEDWERQFAVNLQAPFILSQAFAHQLPSNALGKIVNISDARVFHQKPDHFAYRLSKSALLDMTAMFALELAPQICVNAVALGMMLPLVGREDVDLQALANTRIPLQRIGSSEIVVQNVLHLLEQDFITGEVIRVDGGEFLL